MACFPRKLRIFSRSTASFTPAEDENKDTILNNNANPVQIGRYIKREETALFTPKTSEQTRTLRQQQQLQLQQGRKSQEQIIDKRNNRISNNAGSNNSNSNNKNNNINEKIGENGNLINNESNNVNTFGPKKFISNKANNLSRNNSVNRCNNNNNNNTNNGNGHASNTTLKPVKGRRPTALPSDAPHLAEEEEVEEEEERHREQSVGEAADGTRQQEDLHGMIAEKQALRVNINQLNGYKSNASDLDTPTTPGSTLAVRFFIGQQAHEEDNSSAHSLDAASNTKEAEVTAHGRQHSQPQKEQHEQHQQEQQVEERPIHQHKLRQRIRWKWWQSNQLWNEKFVVCQRTEPFTMELPQMVKGDAQTVAAAQTYRYVTVQMLLLPTQKTQRTRLVESDERTAAT
uniref:Uncharacterized protein n=1 Tax=Ceratitis capitata TaxID=7213 RepID=W8BGQ6_CERCA